jgi:hypothetical protein
MGDTKRTASRTTIGRPLLQCLHQSLAMSPTARITPRAHTNDLTPQDAKALSPQPTQTQNPMALYVDEVPSSARDALTNPPPARESTSRPPTKTAAIRTPRHRSRHFSARKMVRPRCTVQQNPLSSLPTSRRCRRTLTTTAVPRCHHEPLTAHTTCAMQAYLRLRLKL